MRSPFVVATLAVAALVVPVAAAAKPAHRPVARPPADAVAIATKQAKILAYEAFPEWSLQHSTQACPASLDDLVAYTTMPDGNDPWRHRYILYCGANLPAGAKGLAILTLGPDGIAGTADDLASWK